MFASSRCPRAPVAASDKPSPRVERGPHGVGHGNDAAGQLAASAAVDGAWGKFEL